MANISEKNRQLLQSQTLPLNDKIGIAQALIAKALELGSACLAWSGGKDSTVLLDLVRQFAPDIPVIWNSTGVEFPETWPFIRRMADEWHLDLHVARPEPGINFWWCVEKYGWPLFSKDIRQSTHRAARQLSKRKMKAINVVRMSSYCCDWLKEKPSKKVEKELNAEVIFVGNLVAESRMRWWAWLDRSEFYYAKTRGMWVAWPLWCWTDDDIWEYHQHFNLPHCKIYDMGHKRNGCWPCGMDIGIPGNHLSRLRISHPKLWHFLIVEKGLGRELLKIKLALGDGQLDFYSKEKVEEIIELRPCYFDNLDLF